MNVLGIESTAHTASIGLVVDEKITGFKSHTYTPARGGINPKEAANHHRSFFPIILGDLIGEFSLKLENVNRIAVSIGPGLGPSLKTGVELARYLSLKFSIPLVPVNHGVGHLEIARRFSGFYNPLFLYVSGGNTQLVTIGDYRYSVLGETLDIGVGNFLDKIARDLGVPFPGAPVLEKLARNGNKIFECPYTVRGMDVSFSGLYTYLRNRVQKEMPEDIALNAQEYSFTALTEIVERGMAHFGLKEFSITGGVARNRRLQELLSEMARMRGYGYYFPDDRYLSDNGAMIALAGSVAELPPSRTINIRQNDRVDSRKTNWIGKMQLSPRELVGGESIVSKELFLGKESIAKRRTGRNYRNTDLDKRISSARMKKEIKILHSLRETGIKTPGVLFVDLEELSFVMTEIEGKGLAQCLNDKNFNKLLEKLGAMIAEMHGEKISHGDLTLGNVMVNKGLYLIDPSMGETNAEDEDLGIDIHLLKESLKGLGKTDSYKYFLEGYKKFGRYRPILEKVKEIERRRRYS